MKIEDEPTITKVQLLNSLQAMLNRNEALERLLNRSLDDLFIYRLSSIGFFIGLIIDVFIWFRITGGMK